jgi:hypothetical protein
MKLSLSSFLLVNDPYGMKKTRIVHLFSMHSTMLRKPVNSSGPAKPMPCQSWNCLSMNLIFDLISHLASDLPMI